MICYILCACDVEIGITTEYKIIILEEGGKP